jgi:hypothetical protein
MQPTASPSKPLGIIKLLAALIVLAAVCAFNIQNGRQEARYRAAMKALEESMKALEESKRTIAEIQQKLLEMQSRK